MNTRQNPAAGSLPSNGYDQQGNDPVSPQEFSIPSCGIKDVDEAVHALFDTQINFRPWSFTTGNQSEVVNVKKPFVIFATGERFAMAKRLKPFRDRNGALLLPAVSIKRTGIEQESSDVFHGEMTVKRQLSAQADRGFQEAINAYALSGATSGDQRVVGTNSFRLGKLLDPAVAVSKNTPHIWEIITVPFPQFFTAKYEVVFWTAYTAHMNYMLETFLSSQIGPGKSFRLQAPTSSYWFHGLVDSALSSGDNFDDISDAERTIKYTITLSVRGFVLAPQGPGHRVPFRRYISAPNVSFEPIIPTPGSSVVDMVQPPQQRRVSPTDSSTTASDGEATNFLLTDANYDERVSADGLLPETTPNDQVVKRTAPAVLFKKETVDPKTGTVVRSDVITQQGITNNQGETVYGASDIETLSEFFLTR